MNEFEKGLVLFGECPWFRFDFESSGKYNGFIGQVVQNHRADFPGPFPFLQIDGIEGGFQTLFDIGGQITVFFHLVRGNPDGLTAGNSREKQLEQDQQWKTHRQSGLKNTGQR